GGIVGRLRRPYRPLQVISVLATVLPIARKSPLFSPSIERAGKLPIPAKIDLAEPGERLHANRPECRGPLSAGHRQINLPVGRHCTNWSHRNQRGQRLQEVDRFFVRSELESMGGDHEFSDTPRRKRRYSIDLCAALGARSYSLQCWIHASISEARSI